MTLGRVIVREVGTAVAVLAMFVLTLLTPLHQAASLQHDLGYDVGWSLCAPLDQDQQGDDDPTALKCPAAHLGHGKSIGPTLASSPVEFIPTGTVLRYAEGERGQYLPFIRHVGQPRAPPVTV